MERIRETAQVDQLLGGPGAILFKHSTRCPISAGAHREAEKFLARHPQANIYKVHVIEDRSVSNYIAERTGVRHASPQVILLNAGSVQWHESHYQITAEALEGAIGDTR